MVVTTDSGPCARRIGPTISGTTVPSPHAAPHVIMNRPLPLYDSPTARQCIGAYQPASAHWSHALRDIPVACMREKGRAVVDKRDHHGGDVRQPAPPSAQRPSLP